MAGGAGSRPPHEALMPARAGHPSIPIWPRRPPPWPSPCAPARCARAQTAICPRGARARVRKPYRRALLEGDLAAVVLLDGLDRDLPPPHADRCTPRSSDGSDGCGGGAFKRRRSVRGSIRVLELAGGSEAGAGGERWSGAKAWPSARRSLARAACPWPCAADRLVRGLSESSPFRQLEKLEKLREGERRCRRSVLSVPTRVLRPGFDYRNNSTTVETARCGSKNKEQAAFVNPRLEKEAAHPFLAHSNQACRAKYGLNQDHP
jgi:hypothetical protein